MWTTANQSVIASIAFHPNDRVLVIATTNEVYFWDWSHRQPFLQTATSNPREKVYTQKILMLYIYILYNYFRFDM